MKLGKQFYICHMNEEYTQSVVVLNEKDCFLEWKEKLKGFKVNIQN